MKALFPIKKEYVKKIFDGSKAYEYRKSFCSLEVDTIVIYESRGKGLVVGEFEIADRLCDTPRNIWERYREQNSESKNIFSNIPELQRLIDLIHKYQRAYDQEGYIEVQQNNQL